MKVKDLIKALNEFNPDYRVVISNHGQDSAEKQDEILGCYEEDYYDDDDKVIETVVTLYEY